MHRGENEYNLMLVTDTHMDIEPMEKTIAQTSKIDDLWVSLA